MRAVEPLRDYQVNDLAFYMSNKRCLNLSDPGTGKTPPTCVYMFWVWANLGGRSVWVQPKSLMQKNREELLRFSHFEPEDVVIVDGTPKQRDRIYASDAKVFLMGFDMFGREWEKLWFAHPDIALIAVDEFHMGFSTIKSRRTQSWLRAQQGCERFVGMTGTIINGRYDSAYPAIHAIEPRYYGSHENFLNTHAEVDFFGNIDGWKNPEKLTQIFGRHAIRHTFREVYGEEAKVIIPQPVSMGQDLAAKYQVLHEKALIELQDSFIDAGLPGVWAMRARQMLAHPETFEVPGRQGKDDLLEVHFNDGGPLVVFACFMPEQERIAHLAAECGRKVGLMNGDTTSKERTQIDAMFRAGDLDTVVCSQAVAGVGFNWHHCERLVFNSLDYQDGSFLQAYRRGIRGKRDTPLAIYVPQYRDSIDYRLMEVVERKSTEANAVDDTREVFRLAG